MPPGRVAPPQFTDFTAELKKRYKRELNLQERNDWDLAVAQARERVAALTPSITQAEREIDNIVYRLFDLTGAKSALTTISSNTLDCISRGLDGNPPTYTVHLPRMIALFVFNFRNIQTR